MYEQGNLGAMTLGPWSHGVAAWRSVYQSESGHMRSAEVDNADDVHFGVCLSLLVHSRIDGLTIERPPLPLPL